LSVLAASVLPVRSAVVDDVDLGSVEMVAGASCYAAGFRHLAQRDIRQLAWDSNRRQLIGIVRGTSGRLWKAAAHFSATRPSMFLGGQCQCAARYNCQHVVALVLAAAGVVVAEPAVEQAPWEESLRSLLEPPRAGPSAVDGRRDTPIAIELSLRDGPVPMQLRARLVQQGGNGNWTAGPLSWSKLDSLLYYGGHPRSHLRLLKELYCAHLAGTHRSLRFTPADERTIDLAAFESRQLWPLLDEAALIGLPVLDKRSHDPMPRYTTAEPCVDVSQPRVPGPLTVRLVFRIDGALADVVPIRFIGTAGHGLIYSDRQETEDDPDPSRWRFQLARLGSPVPAELQRLALSGQRLTVPAADAGRFGAEFCPRLAHTADVISSDGSFSPPVVSPPTLVLAASYGPEHSVELDWVWSYQVGDRDMRAPLGAEPDELGYRDLDAELEILTGLEQLPPDRFGVLPAPVARPSAPVARPPGLPRPPARLDGIDTMLFSTELLPLLASQPGVAVEVSGDPADYRDASDSVTIGISTDAIAGQNDWFDLGVTITIEGQPVPFGQVFVALCAGQRYLLLDSGAYVSLDKPELRDLAALIEEARALHDSPAGELRISRFHFDLWGALVKLGVVERQAEQWQRQVVGLLPADAVDHDIEPPATLTARLRPYQLEGFRWLAFLWRHKLGGILADDMGLGKTLESLALVCHARAAEPAAPPFLVVAPTSVLSNWTTEAARFAPELKVVAISGTMARRGRALDPLVAGADVVVTSYQVFRLDFDGYQQLEWSGLLLDEAQHVKNRQSKIHVCARRLSAPFKIAITGTPLENNLMELWSLLSIAAPGLFPDPKRFDEYYAKPIEREGNVDLLAQLRRRMRLLIKRRTKEQVAADLPEKQEQVLEVELHPRHRKIYQTHLQRERQKVLRLLAEDDYDANRFTILQSLTLLRQLSLHAGLVAEEHCDVPSSKIDVLLELLADVVDGGHRALVFSQFTRFLRLVRERLDEAGIPYCYLDGKTRDRPIVLARFKAGDIPVFLISLKAGGFDLNLTEADYCFVLDPWWNPATEAQAVDRAHRIGQTRTVVVYRLISGGTIEERVMELKTRKAELFASVIDSGNLFGRALAADDIRTLLG
jgi:superfamily II DNA or RNA helicase